MRVFHRGHEIDVRRERSLGGWTQLYWSIFREADGFECASGFEDSAETIRDKITQLRQCVDAELSEATPWDEPVYRRAAKEGTEDA